MTWFGWIRKIISKPSPADRDDQIGPVYCRLPGIEGLAAENLEAAGVLDRHFRGTPTVVVKELTGTGFFYCQCNFPFADGEKHSFKFVDRLDSLVNEGVFDVLVRDRGLAAIAFLSPRAKQLFEGNSRLRRHRALFRLAPQSPRREQQERKRGSGALTSRNLSNSQWDEMVFLLTKLLPDEMSVTQRALVAEVHLLESLEGRGAALAKVDAALADDPDESVLLREKSRLLHADGKQEELLQHWAVQVPRLKDRPDLAVERPEPLLHLLATGDAQEALAIVRQVRRKWDRGSQFALIRSFVLQRAGETAEAIDALEGVRKTFPNASSVRLLLARCFLATKQPRRALDVANEGLLIEPNSAELLAAKAEALVALDRPRQAEEALSFALELHPQDVSLLREKWQLLRNAGRNAEASRLWTSYLPHLRAEPNLAVEHPAVLMTLILENGAEEGLAILRKINVDWKNNSLFALSRAIVLEMNGDLEEAIRELERLRPILPDALPLRITLAGALLETDQPDGALEVIEEGLSLEPDSPQLLVHKVRALCALERSGEAGQVVSAAVKRHLGSGALAAQRLHVLVCQHKWEEFMEGLPPVVKMDGGVEGLIGTPATAEVLQILMTQESGAEECAEMFQNWAEGHPDSRSIQRRAAQAILSAKGPVPALQWLDKVLARYPQDVELRLTRLQARSQAGESSDQLVDELIAILESCQSHRARMADLVSLLHSWAPDRFRTFADRYLEPLPSRPFRLSVLGVGLLEAGESERGLEFLEKAVEAETDAFNLSKLARAQLNTSRPEDALRNAERALALKPGDPAALLMRAAALVETGACEAALEALQQLPAKQRETFRARIAQAEALSRLERSGEAIDAWRQLIETEGGSPYLLDQLATASRRAGRHEEALQTAIELAEMSPGSGAAVYEIVEASIQLKRGEDGLSLLERLGAAQSDDALTHYNRGRLLSHLGRAEEAADALQQAVALNDQKTWLWVEAARTFSAAGRRGEARQALQRAAALEPSVGHAQEMIDLGFDEDALELLERGSQTEPEDQEALSVRLSALLNLGRRAEACVVATRLVELDPGNPDPLLNQGWTLELLARLREAEEAYRRVLEHLPEDLFAHLHLGVVLRLQGQTGAAAAAFERVLQLLEKSDSKDDPWETAVGAYAHLQLGHHAVALERYESCIGPSDKVDNRFDRALATLLSGDGLTALRHYDEAIAFLGTIPAGRRAGEADLALRDLRMMALQVAQGSLTEPLREISSKLEQVLKDHPLPG